jgi:hypothetical protein
MILDGQQRKKLQTALNIKLVSLDNIYEVNNVSLNKYTHSLKSLCF